MNSRSLQRGTWIAITVILLAGLYWLDQNNGGPASMLSRCNFLLSRANSHAADVLIVGSSRTGVALDPIAIQHMLAPAAGIQETTVERLAIGHNPLRLNHALLENYLANRGAPGALVLEVTFMTQRSVDRLARFNFAITPEQYIFRRDANLLSFRQLLALPSVAMPYSEGESWLNLWRYRLRGVVLRAGALAYEFLRRPGDQWSGSACSLSDWTREPEWPEDFAFSYDSFKPDAPLNEIIARLEEEMARTAKARSPKDRQAGTAEPSVYPYDFSAPYRSGEVALLRSMGNMASAHNIPVILVPLPLYGYRVDSLELEAFAGALPGRIQVFDVYGQVQADLDEFWYDDAHIKSYPAGALTSALMAPRAHGSANCPDTPTRSTGWVSGWR